MILSDVDILKLLPELLPVESERDASLVNPASLDIRIGKTIQREEDLPTQPDKEFTVRPGEFLLIATWEHITIPNGYVADLRLKSSMARRGWNHLLAFYIDPGWEGILTMEVQNVTRFTPLTLKIGQRFAQLIIHKTSTLSAQTYVGRYNHATKVEGAR